MFTLFYPSSYKNESLQVDLITMYFKLLLLLNAFFVIVFCQENVEEAKGVVRVYLLIKNDTVRRVHVVIFIFNLVRRSLSEFTVNTDFQRDIIIITFVMD